MVTLFAKHTVTDYSNWKQVYDNLASVRKNMGVTGASVSRDPQNANLLTVTHQFNDASTAAAFAHSDDLKTAMGKAGVEGAPELWIAEQIEQTAF
jgi:quinol monooxygenase YgiN